MTRHLYIRNGSASVSGTVTAATPTITHHPCSYPCCFPRTVLPPPFPIFIVELGWQHGGRVKNCNGQRDELEFAG